MRVAVLGAGIVGLACAAELARAGHDVRLFDPDPAHGATHAAAGMVSPAGEAWHGEEALLGLGLDSARMWEEYAAWLEAASGQGVDYRPHGTLLVGQDHDDREVVRRTLAVLEKQGVPFHELGRRELREREPTLSSRVSRGAHLPDDHSVNPRRVAAALLTLLEGRVERSRAIPVPRGDEESPTDAVAAVRTDDGRTVPADAVVVATGFRLPESVPQHRHVRPVRGEVVRARLPNHEAPRSTVRGQIYGQPVYVVPREGGEVVIGATSEEHRGEPVPTVGGVGRLLHAARTMLPGLDRAEVLDVVARHRPGTPDNVPLVGPSGVDGLYLAAGHYRSGVLLAPLTARVIRECLESREAAHGTPYDPLRFERSDR